MGEKIRTKSENRLTLYNNAIVDRGKSTLYYLVNLYNYSIYTEESISLQLTSLYNLILNLENTFQEVKFSMYRFGDIVSPEEYVDNFLETVRLWKPDFSPTKEFLQNIEYTSSQYCFLAINVDDKNAIDLNSMNIKDAAKEVVDNFVNMIANDKQQRVDTKKLDILNQQVLDISQGLIKACPERILMSYYIKRVFPSYNLIINREDYDDTKAVLAYLQQQFVPYFNYFEMENVGVELFGAKVEKTYGCIIDVIEFPEEIPSETWNMCVDGMVVNVKTLPKDKAKLKFMRKKSDIEFEEESMIQAGGHYNLEIDDFKNIVEVGLAAVSLNRKIVEVDVHILILANSVEELKKKRSEMISALKSQNVRATFSPRQAETYVKSFIKLRPREYDFLMDLRYPLAFKLDNGGQLGDFDSKFQSPIMGELVTKAEATGM